MYLNNAKKEEMIRQIHRNDRSQHLPNSDQREQKIKKPLQYTAATGKPHSRTATNGSKNKKSRCNTPQRQANHIPEQRPTGAVLSSSCSLSFFLKSGGGSGRGRKTSFSRKKKFSALSRLPSSTITEQRAAQPRRRGLRPGGWRYRLRGRRRRGRRG